MCNNRALPPQSKTQHRADELRLPFGYSKDCKTGELMLVPHCL